MIDENTPVVLFTYNRLDETVKTIEALQRNTLALNTILYIFCDGARSEDDVEAVNLVRKFVKQISGFKEIIVNFSDVNKGLSKSVISGVSFVLRKHKQVIVLEDDIVVSTDFLEYMNKCLYEYKHNESVWSVTGYSPKIKINKSYKHDLYLSNRACSWSWATWDNRWNNIDWETKDFNLTRSETKLFNIAGNDMARMLELNNRGRIDSWAIRWNYFQFKNNMFSIYPIIAKAQNIGFSPTATHTTGNSSKWDVILDSRILKIDNQIIEHIDIIKSFKKYHDLSLYTSIGYFMIKYNFLYKEAKYIINKLRKLKIG